jgi:hypothetical protein
VINHTSQRCSGVRTWLGLRAAAIALAACAGLAGCESAGKDEPNGGLTPITLTPAKVSYEEVAQRHNANAQNLRALFSDVVVRLSFLNEQGERQDEQGEGRLQMVQPSYFAMSIGKLGEIVFWLGADEDEYWWFDFSTDRRILFVGRHELYEQSRARALGVVVPPRQLMTLLGTTMLPATGGLVQGSSDGKLVGVTVTTTEGGRKRLWYPTTGERMMVPVKIEIYGRTGELEMVADLSNPQTANIRGVGVQPLVPTRVAIGHIQSESKITLDLSGMQDGIERMTEEAFSYRSLYKRLKATEAYSLDPRGSGATGAGK